MKIKTIAFRLFLNFGVMLVVFGLLISLMQNLFLSSVQSNHYKSLLSSAASDVLKAIKDKDLSLSSVKDDEQVQSIINDLALENGVQILVYSDAEQPAEYNTGRTELVFDNIKEEGSDKKGGIFFSKSIRTGTENQVNYMSYIIADKDSDWTLEVRTQTVLLQENVFVTTLFNRLVIVIAVALSLVWAYLFSRIFTHPIVSMNEVTKRMAALDFGSKIKIDRSDELGQLAESINIMGDKLNSAITELKQKNVQLKSELEREKSLDAMRKKFVSDVSHELKTPLSIIQGYSESLKLSVNKSAEKRNKYCDYIIEETQKMTKLVRDLLDLSYYQSGYVTLNPEQTQISDLIAATVERMKPMARQKNINIEFDAKPQVLKIDPFRIEHALTNYVENAISHCSGKLKISIKGETAGDFYKISVFNSGEHIDPVEIQKIWTPFYRVDKARSREEGRFGVGLSIVKALVELHGGQYGAQNVEGGVEFYMMLPLI